MLRGILRSLGSAARIFVVGATRKTFRPYTSQREFVALVVSGGVFADANDELGCQRTPAESDRSLAGCSRKSGSFRRTRRARSIVITPPRPKEPFARHVGFLHSGRRRGLSHGFTRRGSALSRKVVGFSRFGMFIAESFAKYGNDVVGTNRSSYREEAKGMGARFIPIMKRGPARPLYRGLDALSALLCMSYVSQEVGRPN